MSQIDIKTEFKELIIAVKKLDKKIIVVFLTVAMLQTFAFYFTSRRFFRANLFEQFENYSDPYLIEYLYWFIGDFFTFFILGIVVIKFVLKEKLSDYGLQIGDFNVGLKISLLFLSVMIILIWFVSATPSFAEKYPHLSSAK